LFGHSLITAAGREHRVPTLAQAQSIHNRVDMANRAQPGFIHAGNGVNHLLVAGCIREERRLDGLSNRRRPRADALLIGRAIADWSDGAIRLVRGAAIGLGMEAGWRAGGDVALKDVLTVLGLDGVKPQTEDTDRMRCSTSAKMR
jgi:hypothetical protein